MAPDVAGSLFSEDRQVDSETVRRIVAKHAGARGALLAVLEDIQAAYGYLPADALKASADEMRLSLVDVYGVATFYRAFSLKPRGRHLVSVCLGTACHVRGAGRVLDGFETRLAIKAGQTTPDREFTLETVNCLGACALGPTVVIDGRYFPHVGVGRIDGMLEAARRGLDRVDIESDARFFPLNVSCPRCGLALMDAGHFVDGHRPIQLTAAFQQTRGWLRLSCLYGSCAVESEYGVPADAVTDLLCPHCRAPLPDGPGCPECGTRMASMSVRKGGNFHVCRMRGCKGHMLDLG